MTSGIYHLEFSNGDTYVGQAKDLDKRWQQHFNDLKKNKHTKAMQLAYYNSNCTLPEASILLVCHEHYLDLYESYYIHNMAPILNHQVPKPLDEYTLKWMVALANSDCAEHPIPKLIEEVYSGNEAKRELGTLRDSWDDRVALETAAIEGYEEALDKLEALEAELEEWKERAVESLRFRVKLESLGWWGRLWKMW